VSDGEIDNIGLKGPRPEIVQRFKGHTNAVFGLCSARQSNRLVSTSSDGTLRLWNTQTGAEVGLPARTATGISTLACSANQSAAFSVARRNIYVFDPSRNAVNAVLLGPQDFLKLISVSDDSQLLIGATEGEVLVWDLRPDQLRRRACEVANRNLTGKEWRQYVSSAIPCQQVCPSIHDTLTCKDE
jgi:WD40 repeat protein